MSKTRTNWYTVVDLFSGCGAVTCALKKRHFKVIAAVDNDPVACKTYRRNHPNVRLYEDDIASVDPATIKAGTLERNHLDLLVVCAPCQPFSSQGKKRSDDSRVPLILESIRFAATLNPRMIFFENVPGLATPRFRELLTSLRNGLTRFGYHLGEPEMVDAADYGVPQRRQRCILLAKYDGPPPRLPEPITPKGLRVTVKSAIAHLPSLRSGERCVSDPLHFARNHKFIALQRLGFIPSDGGDRSSLPSELVLKCHKEHRGHPDVYGRMWWDDVSPTLTTGCTDITKGRFAHPKDDRAITLREAARLQTFSDSYHFEGNPQQIARQIGNAVPVRLVEELALTLRQGLKRCR